MSTGARASPARFSLLVVALYNPANPVRYGGYMDHPVGAEAENKLITILKILAESSEPLGSITLARLLEDEGVFLSERAVRYHLKIADARGFTIPGGRDGRMITPEGRQGG